MPGETLSFSKSSLAYAKLAATPTDTAWSQVYNAGNLFACLSLTIKEAGTDPVSLQTLGKDLFSNLETEFFTLEEKNLATIKDAIEKSTKHIPENIIVNFCLAFFKEQTLYLFLLGSGRMIMKRGEAIGVLLEGKEHENGPIRTASGYLQNGDTLILETSKFAKNVSDQHIREALQLSLPSDIAESLSIHMHEQTDGDQAAIVVTYHGTSVPTDTTTETEQDEAEEQVVKRDEDYDDQQEPSPQLTETSSPSLPFTAKLSELINKFRLPFPRHNRRIVMGGLTHRKKFFLSITLIILMLLIVSVAFTKQKQENTQTTALFESIYTPALKSYDEGKALVGLNDALSREDLLAAEKLLLDGRDKFPKGSKEAKQIEELLAKVQSELGGSEVEANTSAKEVTVGENSLLAVEKATPTGLGFSQNDALIFYVTAKDAVSVEKNGGDKITLVANDDAWEQAAAIVPYQANFYILDKKNGVLKYVPSGESYSQSDYFTDSAPDLSKAVGMAIDSSVWILFSDGSIKKFTRGVADAFSIKGLTKPFNNPTKIYTDPDIENVYILDNGNSRVVKLVNDGTFQAEYSAGVIKTAKDFEVLEPENKIRILSGDKIWEIEM